MSKFDPKFWEISVSSETLEALLVESDLLEKILKFSTESESGKEARDAEVANLFRQVQEIISLKLTDKQREIVDLYFNHDLSQQSIAERLGIPQQVVSKHLFGVIRNGQRIGGAMSKIRKECRKLGVGPKSGCENV